MKKKFPKVSNRRLFALIMIFIILCFLLLVEKLVPRIMYNIGVNNFLKGNYEKAYKDFQFAVDANPTNRDYRYYYVETMLKLPPTMEIQKNMYDISQKNLADSADLISDRQIDLWKGKILLNSGENYIEKTAYNDSILRWDITKMPLKVCIKSSTNQAPAYYMPQIQKAFAQWQASTYDMINFSYINDDIYVDILPLSKNKNCENAVDCKYVVAYTEPKVNGNILNQMKMTFYATDNFNRPFSQREVYNTALHEAGHALGIMGHSFNPDDVMFMENNEDRINDTDKSDFQLISPRDLNTIKLLYKLTPNITNTPIDKFDTKHQVFAQIVMGNDKEVNSAKLLEAQNYVNSAPTLPNGYIDLASAYAEGKQYNNATQALFKALELCSNDNEKFVVYYNLAIIYSNIKDWNNAIKYGQIAKQMNPSADIDGMIAMCEYNMGNKTQAISDYQMAILRHPEDIVSSINLAIIYLKEFNLVSAGHVLNEFVKANPTQATDSRITRYGLLMFFFR